MSKVLEILVEAKSNAGAVFKKDATDAKAANKTVSEDQAKTTGNWLKDIAQKAKEARRERRTSGESALQSALTGGGIGQLLGLGVGGLVVDKVGEALEHLTGKILEMRKALSEGKSNWADFTQGALESLPIIGNFAKAGANINEILTHTKELAGVNETIAESTDIVSEIKKHHSEQMRGIRKEFENETIELHARMSLIGKVGFERETQEAMNAAEKTIHDITEKRDEKIHELKEKNAPELNQLLKKRSELKDIQDPDEIAQDGKSSAQKAVEDARETLVTLISQARQAQNNSIKEVTEKSDKELAEAQKVLQAQEVERQRLHEVEMLKIMTDSGQRIIESKSRENDSILSLNRDAYGVELAELQQENEKKKAELDKALEERIASEHGNQDAINQLRAQNQKEKDQLDKETATKRKVSESLTIQDTALKLMQMGADAGNVQLKAQAELVTRLREEKDIRTKLLNIVNDSKQNYTERHNAQIELNQLDAVGKMNVANSLKQTTTAALEMQSQFGETFGQREQARRQLEKQKLIDATKQAAADANKIIADPKSTEAQRAAALANAKKIADTTARQYQQDIFGNPQQQSVLQAQETHQLTGLALAAQEDDDRANEQLSITAEALEVQKQMLDVLKAQTSIKLVATSN